MFRFDSSQVLLCYVFNQQFHHVCDLAFLYLVSSKFTYIVYSLLEAADVLTRLMGHGIFDTHHDYTAVQSEVNLPTLQLGIYCLFHSNFVHTKQTRDVDQITSLKLN